MSKISYILFRILRFFVKLFCPKFELTGTENIPDEPVLFIGNHSQMYGPLAGELYFDKNTLIWCSGEMMELKEVPKYAYKDFWSGKPAYIRWFYRLLSYIIAPLSVIIFNNAKTIGVYRDKRIVKTFKQTVSAITEGKSVLIFPEHNKPYNQILCDFQEGFVDIAKLYFKKTGKRVKFLPVYIAPKLKKVYIGKAIEFNPDNDITEERLKICNYLKETITETATALPTHTVIPYNNVSKKEYGTNKAE